MNTEHKYIRRDEGTNGRKYRYWYENAKGRASPDTTGATQADETTYADQVSAEGADGNEHVVVYDDDGNVLLSKGGKKDAVDYTPDEQKLLYGASLIHNHPSEASISGGDLASAQRFGMKSVSVVTSKYIYTVTPESGGAFSKDSGNGQQIWDEEQSNAIAKQRGRDWNWPDLSHQVMEKVAARMHLRYTRRAR